MTKQYIHVYILFKHNWIAVHIITTRKTILTTTPSPMIINEENIRPNIMVISSRSNIMVISSRSYELIRNHFSICQQKQTRYTFNEHWDRKWGITMEIFLYSLSHNKNICRCQPHHKIAARVIYHLLLGGTPNACLLNKTNLVAGTTFRLSFVYCWRHYNRASMSISTNVQGSGMPNFLSTCRKHRIQLSTQRIIVCHQIWQIYW